MPFTFSQQPCYTGLHNRQHLKFIFCWNNVGPLRLYATLKCVYSVRVWVRRTIIFTSIIIDTPSVSHEGRIRKEGSLTSPLCTLSPNHPATWIPFLCTRQGVLLGLSSGDRNGHRRNLPLCMVNHFSAILNMTVCLSKKKKMELILMLPIIWRALCANKM